MSHELYVVPSSFREWTEEQWDAFFEGKPEWEYVGKARYVGLVQDVIAYQLEGGRPGSRFPLLMGRREEEVIGWSADEVGALEEEVRRVRRELAGLPVDRATLRLESEAEVAELVSQLRKPGTGAAVNLSELFGQYLEGFERMAERARATGQGLWLSF